MNRAVLILLLFSLAHFVAAYINRESRVACRNYLTVAIVLSIAIVLVLALQ